eukprot:Mrub_06653.p2 GENE.Mrub_06653~~Mrub_06653.p2  ORF type:complete len:194 (+),score=-5.40 Mrub_06653:258-839(+)
MIQYINTKTIYYIRVLHLHDFNYISKFTNCNLQNECYKSLLQVRYTFVHRWVYCLIILEKNQIYEKSYDCRNYNKVHQLYYQRDLINIYNKFIFLNDLFKIEFDKERDCKATKELSDNHARKSESYITIDIFDEDYSRVHRRWHTYKDCQCLFCHCRYIININDYPTDLISQNYHQNNGDYYPLPIFKCFVNC